MEFFCHIFFLVGLAKSFQNMSYVLKNCWGGCLNPLSSVVANKKNVSFLNSLPSTMSIERPPALSGVARKLTQIEKLIPSLISFHIEIESFCLLARAAPEPLDLCPMIVFCMRNLLIILTFVYRQSLKVKKVWNFSNLKREQRLRSFQI